MNRIETFRRLTDWLIIVVFAGLLSIPLFLSIIQRDRSFSETEKRPLAGFPQTTDLKAAGEFPHQFDSYYQDHFGLREWLIHRYQQEMGKHFGLTGVPFVVEGRKGWFFLASEKMRNDFKGRLRFDKEELQNFCQGITAKHDWLGRRNIAYIPVVAANKQTVYPEYLPDSYSQPYKQTRLDQLLNSCNTKGRQMFLDLRSPLVRDKVKGRLYDKTDTHWNYLGAHTAYLEIMDRVGKNLADIGQPKQFSFEASWKQYYGGDLALMLRRKSSLREIRPVLKEEELTAHEKRLPRKLKRILPLHQLKPEFWIHKESKKRLLVLHDSFFNNLKLLISENFAETLYVFQFYDEQAMGFSNRETLEKLVSTFKPDIVIEGVVERYLERFLISIDQDWQDH